MSDGSTGSLSGAMTAQRSDGYLAVGFSTDGSMVGSDAVIGWVGSTPSVAEYHLEGQTERSIKAFDPNPLEYAAARQEGDVMVVEFKRPLAPAATNRRRASTGPEPALGPTTQLWAMGDSPAIVYHGKARGSYPIHLGGDPSLAVPTSAIPRRAQLIYVHAVLMTVGWGILLPLGVAMAVGLKRSGKAWFHLHRALAVCGLALGIAGIVISLDNFQEFGATEDSDVHGSLGIAVTALGCLQPLNGLLRPKKGAKHRFLWECVHKGSGWSALILAIPTILIGLNLFSDQVGEYYPGVHDALLGSYAAVLAIVVIALVARLVVAARRENVNELPKTTGEGPVKETTMA